MRSELGNECRKHFRKMVKMEFPEFREDKGQILPPGRYVWTRQDPSGIWFHILFVLHHSKDKFTTEVGWDFDGKLTRHRLVRNEMHEIFEEPLSFRSSAFWSRIDYWWLLVLRPEEHERVILYKDDPVEQCLPLVAPAVVDAVAKIKEHVLPYFERIIQMHGKKPAQPAGS
jgi:hypothetical protein